MVLQPASMRRRAGSLQWGGSSFLNFRVGESVEVGGHTIALTDVRRQWCALEVDGRACELEVSRLALPREVEGLRLFIADNRPVASLTDDAPLHQALAGDALLCVSDASRPLLDPERFIFPVSRRDGFQWRQLEDSHMFAYLGPRWDDKTRLRSHEGVDLDLHDARGIEKHPIVAVEDARVAWVQDYREGEDNPDHREACVCLQSEREPQIWYIYTHLYNRTVTVRAGDRVTRGQVLGTIWGDGLWGHLHFSVVHRSEAPPFPDRYRCALNCWPGLYELWNGSLNPAPVRRTHYDLRFGRVKGLSGNYKLADAYAPVRGIGWLIDDWCTAGRVETYPSGEEEGYACLRRTLFRGTPAEATNPADAYTFVVDVEPGQYEVRAQVGDCYNPSWQRVEINGTDAGTFGLAKGETAWTEPHHVEAAQNRLHIRLHLGDETTHAGLCRLIFDRA